MAAADIQKISAMVEWYIQDRQVELRFVPNLRGTGRIAPEFDFEYWIDGRRVTDKALAYMIMSEMLRRAYTFNLARIVSALHEHSWRHYVANQDYPEWLVNDQTRYELRRPVGRPRKAPAILKFDDEALNTGAEKANT